LSLKIIKSTIWLKNYTAITRHRHSMSRSVLLSESIVPPYLILNLNMDGISAYPAGTAPVKQE
jgi:hypothetical protein